MSDWIRNLNETLGKMERIVKNNEDIIREVIGTGSRGIGKDIGMLEVNDHGDKIEIIAEVNTTIEKVEFEYDDDLIIRMNGNELPLDVNSEIDIDNVDATINNRILTIEVPRTGGDEDGT